MTGSLRTNRRINTQTMKQTNSFSDLRSTTVTFHGRCEKEIRKRTVRVKNAFGNIKNKKICEMFCPVGVVVWLWDLNDEEDR